ncbi:MAG: ATP-binding protein [Sphingobacteriaceae bacterium]
MGSFSVIAISFCYLVLLFGIAYWAEKRTVSGKRMLSNPYVYALSLAVYCTAWTFYGSIGRASQTGMDFLAIYIGPTILAPVWWIFLRKMIRISKVQGITSIADFISSRYGKNVTLGGIVTLVCILGIIPYIALQIKAISTSLDFLIGSDVVRNPSPLSAISNTPFYVTVVLAVFIVFFSTRKIDTSERHEGMVTAIAFESIVKLIAFLCGGIFIVYWMYNGLGDIFSQALLQPKLKALLSFNSANGYFSWVSLAILSMFAVLLLPRQFQIGVVENVNEQHLNKAIWLFPLYLFLINLLVLPIALAGQLSLPASTDPDFSILALPLSQHHHSLALLIYIGGFSAATGMIIVETIALSTMLSNNVLIPLIVGVPFLKKVVLQYISKAVIYIRRFSILLILLVSYGYFYEFAEGYSLVSIGLISFAAVSQFAPALLGGMYWKQGTKTGALVGILVGFACWFYTLVIPSIVSAGLLPQSIMTQGLFGIASLKPNALFGLTQLDYLSQSFFWSMLFNAAAYFGVSLYTKASKQERNQAELFVNVFKYAKAYESSVVWKGKTRVKEVRLLMVKFLGAHGTKRLFDQVSKTYGVKLADEDQADSRLIVHVEKVLSGLIGSASARMLVSSIVTDNEISIAEMVGVIKESQELISLNKELRLKTEELKKASDALAFANTQLLKADELRDEFLYTVTHELRTPLTSIRAFSEILHDHPDIEIEKRQEFLQTMTKEIERLSRLISQVLDLEKLQSGNYTISLEMFSIKELVQDAIAPFKQVLSDRHIQFSLQLEEGLPDTMLDRDAMIQAITNLVSNAIKFCDQKHPAIVIQVDRNGECIRLQFTDNGPGISDGDSSLIFEKFFQVHGQITASTKGSGLGLAITKKIIELHQGHIWVEKSELNGANFVVNLPLNTSTS